MVLDVRSQVLWDATSFFDVPRFTPDVRTYPSVCGCSAHLPSSMYQSYTHTSSFQNYPIPRMQRATSAREWEAADQFRTSQYAGKEFG
jgi:hypothetical protein